MRTFGGKTRTDRGGGGDDSFDAGRVRALLEPGRIQPAFQPIVRLNDGDVIGYEALARMRDPSGWSPDRWLAKATEVGMRADLEIACWQAIARAGEPPGDRLLFVNAGAELLTDERFDGSRASLPDQLVLELGRPAPTNDYEPLRECLAHCEDTGVRLAVDETGAGLDTLEHMLALEPQYVKLNRQLISGIDRDRRLRAVVSSIVALVREIGGAVVAVGVERPGELVVLSELGVKFAQGYLLASPTIAPPWPKLIADEPTMILVGAPGRADHLDARLRRARDARSASDALCEHVATLHATAVSVYLERGATLRLQAQRGQWRIMDGFPLDGGQPTTGVSFPLRVGHKVIGLLNIDPGSALDETVTASIQRSAAALERRLVELGWQPSDGPLPRLVRRSQDLSGLVDSAEVREAIVTIASEVSGFESAMLAERGAGGSLEVTASCGTLGWAFDSLRPTELSRMASLVARVGACYTPHGPGADQPNRTDFLSSCGARSMAVLPLLSFGRRTGILVVADSEVRPASTEDIEALELLAAEAARALDLAGTVAELRDRASRDPLTGLANHSVFYEALEQARPLVDGRGTAVVVADLDGFKPVNDTHGHRAGDRVLHELAVRLTGALRPVDRLYRIGGDEFAALLPDVTEDGALTVASRMCRVAGERLREWRVTLSAGVAFVYAGESHGTAVDRADAMLYEVKRSPDRGTARLAR